jgi:hypothetical protein
VVVKRDDEVAELIVPRGLVHWVDAIRDLERAYPRRLVDLKGTVGFQTA